jgi:hypothetical protein
MGLSAMNIGVSKGSTFDRVLIFPTKPMLKYIKTKDPSALTAPERLYVAVTRTRRSVAFIVSARDADYVPRLLHEVRPASACGAELTSPHCLMVDVIPDQR